MKPGEGTGRTILEFAMPGPLGTRDARTLPLRLLHRGDAPTTYDRRRAMKRGVRLPELTEEDMDPMRPPILPLLEEEESVSYLDRPMGQGPMGDIARYQDILKLMDAARRAGDRERYAELRQMLEDAPRNIASEEAVDSSQEAIGMFPRVMDPQSLQETRPDLTIAGQPTDEVFAEDITPVEDKPGLAGALQSTLETGIIAAMGQAGIARREADLLATPSWQTPDILDKQREKIYEDPESLKIPSNINKALDTFTSAFSGTDGSLAEKLTEANQKTRELYPDIPSYLYTAMGIVAEEGLLLLATGGGSLSIALGKQAIKLSAKLDDVQKFSPKALQALQTVLKASGKTLELTGAGLKTPMRLENYLGTQAFRGIGAGGKAIGVGAREIGRRLSETPADRALRKQAEEALETQGTPAIDDPEFMQVGISPATGEGQRVTPFFSSEARKRVASATPENIEAVYAEVVEDAREYMTQRLTDAGIQDITVSPNFGRFGEAEPSLFITARVAPEQEDEFLRLVADIADIDFDQSAVLIHRPLRQDEKGLALGIYDEAGNITTRDSGLGQYSVEPFMRYTKPDGTPITAQEMLIIDQAAKDAGIAGYATTADNMGIDLINVSKYDDAENFNNALEIFDADTNLSGIFGSPESRTSSAGIRRLSHYGATGDDGLVGYDALRGSDDTAKATAQKRSPAGLTPDQKNEIANQHFEEMRARKAGAEGTGDVSPPISPAVDNETARLSSELEELTFQESQRAGRRLSQDEMMERSDAYRQKSRELNERSAGVTTSPSQAGVPKQRVTNVVNQVSNNSKVRRAGEWLHDRHFGLYSLAQRTTAAMTKGLDEVLDKYVPSTGEELRNLLRTAPGAANAGAQRVNAFGKTLKQLAPTVDHSKISYHIALVRMKEIFQMDEMSAKRFTYYLPGDTKARKFASVADVNNAIASLKKELGNVQFKEVLAGTDETLKLYKAERKRLVDAGLISKQEFDLWESTQPYYSPFKYADAQGKPTRSKKHKARGAGYQILDRGVDELTDKSNLNRLQDPLMEIMPVQVVMNSIREKSNRLVDTALRALTEDAPDKVRKISSVDSLGRLKIGNTNAGEKKLTVFRDGQKEIYAVPDWFHDELVTFNSIGISDNVISKVFTSSTDVTRRLLTSANPLFYGPAYLIDLLTAFIGRGVNPFSATFGPAIRALARHYDKGAINTDQLANDAMRLSGGEQSRFGGMTSIQRQAGSAAQVKNRIKTRIEDDGGEVVFTEDINWRAQVTNKVSKALAPFEAVGEMVEQAPRRAFFRRQLDKRVPGWKKMSAEELASLPAVQEAAGEAIELTINFNRGARLTKIMNPYTMFINASFEGFKVPFRQMITNPRYKKGAQARFAGFMASTAGLYAYNLSYPEYRDIPDDIKLGGLVVMLPSWLREAEIDPITGKKKPNYIAIIPKIREWAMFTAPLHGAMEYMATNDAKTFTGLMKAIGFSVNTGWNVASPFPGRRGIPTSEDDLAATAVAYAPPLAGSLLELTMNKDYYFDTEINNPDIQGAPREGIDPYTQRPSEWIADYASLGVLQPTQAQHMVDSLFGGLGRMSFDLVDWAADALAPRNDPKIEKMLDKYETLNASQRRTYLNSISVEDRDALLFRYREPEGIPVIGEVARRFDPQRAGGLRERGLQQAASQTGFSVDDYKNASRENRRIQDKIFREKKEAEAKVASNKITKKQFRADLKSITNKYRIEFDKVKKDYPNAPQFSEDAAKTEEFFNIVNTVGGTIENPRTAGQQLADEYYSIQLEEEGQFEGAEESPAWNKFFKQRDAFRNSLSEEQRELLDFEIASRETPLERELTRVQRQLSEYWEAGVDDFIERIGRQTGRMGDVVKFMEASNRVKEQMMDPDVRGRDDWKFFRQVDEAFDIAKSRGIIKRERDYLLRQKPELERLLKEWGYRETPLRELELSIR